MCVCGSACGRAYCLHLFPSPRMCPLQYDLALYMIAFLNRESRAACNLVSKRFQRLTLLTYPGMRVVMGLAVAALTFEGLLVA